MAVMVFNDRRQLYCMVSLSIFLTTLLQLLLCHAATAAPLDEGECGLLMAFPAASKAMGLTTCSKPVDCGSLKGLRCSEGGFVQQLELPSSNITGTLPPEWAKLESLSRLNLESNQIEGTLPSEWSLLKNLFSLRFSSNRIQGPLPLSWSGAYGMQNLVELELAGNNIKGTLPSEWGDWPSISRLDVSANNITGQLPREWGTLHAIHFLNVENNNLDGHLPEEWTPLYQPGHRILVQTGNNITWWTPQVWLKSYCEGVVNALAYRKDMTLNNGPILNFRDYVDHICKPNPSSRKWTALGFLWGFSVMLMAVAAARAWLPNVPECSTASTAPSPIAKLLQWVLTDLLHALLLLANIASDIWVLLKIMPKNSADSLWWPYGLLLTAIILPHIISSVIAWIRWHRKAPPTTNMAACIGWWTLSFVPFCLALHLGLVYRALTAPFRRGDGKPVELAVRSRWHLHPAAVVAAVDPPSYPKLLDCVVGVTQDPLSLIAVTAFFLSKKKVLAEKVIYFPVISHVLEPSVYLICVLLSGLHLLRAEWVLLSMIIKGRAGELPALHSAGPNKNTTEYKTASEEVKSGDILAAQDMA